jgi:hypothetical protein
MAAATGTETRPLHMRASRAPIDAPAAQPPAPDARDTSRRTQPRPLNELIGTDIPASEYVRLERVDALLRSHAALILDPPARLRYPTLRRRWRPRTCRAARFGRSSHSRPARNLPRAPSRSAWRQPGQFRVKARGWRLRRAWARGAAVDGRAGGLAINASLPTSVRHAAPAVATFRRAGLRPASRSCRWGRRGTGAHTTRRRRRRAPVPSFERESGKTHTASKEGRRSQRP